MALIAKRPYIRYGSPILIKSDLTVEGVSVWEQDNVELISIEMHGVAVHSVYTPSNEKFVLLALGHGYLPHNEIEDFDSPTTIWGYTTTDDNREAVEQWADTCNLTLSHNEKLYKSFNGARWKRGYNPDLIFVHESIANLCGKSFMWPIPHTQHLPICARANPIVVAHPTPFRRRFNLRKADRNGYLTELDKLIEDVEPQKNMVD